MTWVGAPSQATWSSGSLELNSAFEPHLASFDSPVSKGVRPHPTNVLDMPGYDIKPFDGEAPALEMRELGVPFHYHCSQVHFDTEW